MIENLIETNLCRDDESDAATYYEPVFQERKPPPSSMSTHRPRAMDTLVPPTTHHSPYSRYTFMIFTVLVRQLMN